MRRPRRNRSTIFKSNVATAALTGEKTLTKLSLRFDVRPSQIAQWKSRLLVRADDVFGSSAERGRELSGDVLKELHAKIGQQSLEIDVTSGALGRIAGSLFR